VWNFGIYAPTAQITDRTAFLVQGDGALEAGVSTPTGWMVAIEPGRMAVPRTAGGLGGYMANGPGEELNAGLRLAGNDPADPNGAWVAAADPMRENIYPRLSRCGGGCGAILTWTSRIRPADAGGGDRAGVAGLCLGSHCAAPG
jgi:alpha-L-rhamnosidase